MELAGVITTYVGLVLFGLVFGSFAGASVWRLRARQLVTDKKTGQAYDHAEYKKLLKLTKNKTSQDHSQCLYCGYQLRWYDLVPLVSWLVLKGKCRQCRRPIGLMEPLIEIGMAAFFVGSYVLWPYPLVTPVEIAALGLWLAAGVGLAILFAYDSKWYLLPDPVNYAVIGLGLVSAAVTVIFSHDPIATLLTTAGAIAILSGVYYALYMVSRGGWIGFGDVKLGLGLGLLLADFRLAFIALFAANLLGCLIVIPGLASGKLKRTSRVPFGPLLIAGTVVGKLAGLAIVGYFLKSFI